MGVVPPTNLNSEPKAHAEQTRRALLSNDGAQAAALDVNLGLPSTRAAADGGIPEFPSTTRRLVLTVMFVDIRASSKIVESLSPERTVEFINTYLGLAAQAIVTNQGGVSQFIGDGILATFGLLGEADHGASNALAAAAAIHGAFESADRSAHFSEPVRAVVAIHTGTAILRAVGRAEHTRYGVLGTAVNVASRLEWEGKELGLPTVLSGSVVAALTADVGPLRLVTRKKLRGLSDRVEIWSADLARPLSGNSEQPSMATPSARLAVREPERRWKLALLACVASAGLVSALAAVVAVGPGGVPLTADFTKLAYLALAAVAASACLRAATRSTGNLRVAWMLITASVAALAAGHAAPGGEFGPRAPFWSVPADLAFVLAFVCAIAAAFFFWTLPVARTDPPRVILDGLIVLVCLLGAAWALGLKDVYLSASNDLQQTRQFVFLVGKVLLATVLILVVNRGGRPHQAPLLFLLLSVTVSSIASIVGDAFGVDRHIEAAGQLAALPLVAIAALWPVNSKPLPSEVSVDVWHLALPWLAVGLAAASAFTVLLRGGELDRFLTLMGGTLAALLALSQGFAHRDTLLLLSRSRQSEKALADVIAKAPIGIARADTDLRVVAANPSLGALLREPPEAIVGSAIVKYLDADIQPQMRERLGALASGKSAIVESEIPMVRADGSHVWVHSTSTAVTKPTGRVDYFLTMLQDTTATHEAAQASRANLVELERLNKLKTEFLQSISHEFKTALTGINGFSELLKDATAIDPDDVRQFASDIHREAERLNRMVAEFLELDLVEKSPARVALGSVDLNAIIRREVESMRDRTDGLVFREMLDPNLSKIVGDGERLSDLVRLLLGDAVKHSPDGGQVVIASRNYVGNADITVRDQGAGMRADFDSPLFTGSDLYASNPIRRVVGTGLGLGIAKQIVALHGGRIWMDRLDGIGSEAHVTLPLNLAATDTNATLQAPALAS